MGVTGTVRADDPPEGRTVEPKHGSGSNPLGFGGESVGGDRGPDNSQRKKAQWIA